MARRILAATKKAIRANQSLGVPVVVLGLVVNAFWPAILVAAAVMLTMTIWR